MIWLLAAVALLLYINTLNNGFVLDDLAVIKQNAYVSEGIPAIPKLLTTPYLKGFKRAADTAASNDLYRPASLVMFAVERQLSGESPVLSHLVNVILFAGCVILLFLFLDDLFEQRRTVVAFIAALLFAVHPIHTEVVANIKSRDELLCFFCAFAALITFIKYTYSGKWTQLAAGSLLYFISLLSKETSSSFIAVIPVVFYFFINHNRKRSTHIAVAAIAMVGTYLAIRYAVLLHFNAWHAHIIDLMENELIGAPSAAARMATAILVMGRYLLLLFAPYPLSSDYAFNSIPFVSFGNVWVWLALTAYAGLLATGIIRLIKKPRDPYAFGILFFLVTIALFSNLVFLVGAVMAERFLFFASAGFCLVIAAFVNELYNRFAGADRPMLKNFRLWLAAGPVLLLFAVLTYNRNKDWKDNYTLFSKDVATCPANARLWYALGYEQSTTVVEEETDMNEKARLFSESIAAMQHAVAIYPNYSIAHNDLGKLFQKVKQYDSAEVHLKKSIALNPKDPVNKTDLGGLYFTEGNYRQAAVYCSQALTIEPRNTEILNNLGLCYLMLHRYDSAMIYASRAQEIAPGNALATETIATAINAMKDSLTQKKD